MITQQLDTTPLAAPVPTEPHRLMELGWSEDGLALLTAAVDSGPAEALTGTLLQAARERFGQAAVAWRQSKEVAEVIRLSALADEALRSMNSARAAWTATEHAGRAALAEGKDPAEFEQAAQAAQHQHKVFSARVQHVNTRLLAPARKAATAAGQAVMQAIWEELRQEIASRRTALLDRLATTLVAPLADLLALDVYDAGLYDRHTGAIPAEFLALLKL